MTSGSTPAQLNSSLRKYRENAKLREAERLGQLERMSQKRQDLADLKFRIKQAERIPILKAARKQNADDSPSYKKPGKAKRDSVWDLIGDNDLDEVVQEY